MGRAARANDAARAAQEASRPPIEWLLCSVCSNPYPACKNATPGVERFTVCDRCCVSDLATLMREHFETVRILPTVRVLMGKAPLQFATRPEMPA